MKIDVNGEKHDIAASTVAEALDLLGWGEMRVATALNGAFVPAATRATTQLSDGDQLEVLTAMQGG
ncbi:sulfur carrier protein ThiS [Roseovarius aestuariivivens]|uniref:sulfur carrier protein ThiS n=1 Tax=Roseovarius aestuariivivens TaxID=1888910 RepID=UPI0010800836|nr:sulfur carrier protein ThiS [Roseovarius aestuariivivens]